MVVFGLLAVLLSACSNLPVERPASVQDSEHTGGQVVAFSPDGRWVVSGGWEGNIQLWRNPGGESVRSWRAHQGTVNGIVFDAGSGEFVTAGYDGKLVRWDTDGRQYETTTLPAPATHMTGSTDGNELVVGLADGTVAIWSMRGFEPLGGKQLHTGAIRSVAMAHDGGMIASSSADGSVVVWDRQENVQNLHAPVTDIHTLAFSPDGSALLGGTWFKLFRWSLPAGDAEVLSTDHKGILRSIEFLPNTPYLATISRETDSSIYIVDPETGVTVKRLGRHDLCGADIAVSADGRYIATTSDDATVRWWDLDSSVIPVKAGIQP